MKRILKAGVALVAIPPAVVLLAGCPSDSDVASKNISKDADNYKIYRQIVAYNTFTDKYILEVRGFCSLGNNDSDKQVSYTCKLENGKYIKDIIGRSDNTLVFAHQLVGANASTQRYKVIFKPSVVVPDIDVR